MNKKGFTLIEMLVVVAIIALLAALGWPAMNRAIEASRRSICQSHLRQIGLGMQTYVVDNEGRYPLVTERDWSATWDQTLLNKGLVSKSILTCPSDKVPRTVSGDKRSYAYNGYFGDMNGKQPDTIEGNALKSTKAPADIVMVADRGGAVAVIGARDLADAYTYTDCLLNHQRAGANFLFVDGHVEWSTDTGSYSSGAASYQLWLKRWRCDLP